MKTIFCLFAMLLSLELSAGVLTLEERTRISIFHDAIIETLKQRSLTPRLEKSLMSTMTGRDSAETRKLIRTWTKTFNSKIRYENRGTNLTIYYGFVPLMSLQVISLNPYKVRINDHREMMPVKGQLFEEFINMALQEGYVRNSAKKEARFLLLPKAYAEAASADVRNAIFMSLVMDSQGSGKYLSPSTDITTSLVHDGYLLPDQRMFGFMRTREDKLACDGKKVTGQIHDFNLGNEIDFTATRDEVVFKALSLKIVGKVKKGHAYKFCDSVEKTEPSQEDAYPELLNSESSYGFAYPWEIFISSCRDLNQLKDLHLNCDIHQTFSNLKKLCQKVSDSIFVTPEKFEICYDKFPCQQINSHADWYSSPGDFIRYEKQIKDTQVLNKRLADFKKIYAADLALGAVKQTLNDSFEISNPEKLTNTNKDSLANEIEKINVLQRQINYPPNENAESVPGIGRQAAGVLGLLECCNDAKCKSTMRSMGIELIPATGDTGAEH